MKKTLVFISTLLLSTIAFAKPSNQIEWRVTSPESPRILLGADLPDVPEHGRGMIFSKSASSEAAVHITYNKCITTKPVEIKPGETTFFEFTKGSGCEVFITAKERISYVSGYMLIANH